MLASLAWARRVNSIYLSINSPTPTQALLLKEWYRSAWRVACLGTVYNATGLIYHPFSWPLGEELQRKVVYSVHIISVLKVQLPLWYNDSMSLLIYTVVLRDTTVRRQPVSNLTYYPFNLPSWLKLDVVSSVYNSHVMWGLKCHVKCSCCFLLHNKWEWKCFERKADMKSKNSITL